MLTPERQRLGLIDESVQQALLAARRYFRHNLPANLRDAAVPFCTEDYLPNASVLTNALGGRIAFSATGAERVVRGMVQAAFEEMGLRKAIGRIASTRFSMGNWRSCPPMTAGSA